MGFSPNQLVKTDILYWDDFLFNAVEIEGIRMATVEEIGAMKLDAISRGGRKKDFWDLVEIFDTYSLDHLLQVYRKKYPYNDIADVLAGLGDFSVANEVPDPVCLRKRNWEYIKQEIFTAVTDLGSNSQSM